MASYQVYCNNCGNYLQGGVADGDDAARDMAERSKEAHLMDPQNDGHVVEVWKEEKGEE